MLQDEELRKAYLQLMTSFIMEAPRSKIKSNSSQSSIRDKEKVKYMISRSAEGSIGLSTSGEQLFNSLQLGMSESTVLQLSEHLCLERGYVLISDMRKRLYMYLAENAQIWVEFTQDDISREAIVSQKSAIERKSAWKVYHNNILIVSAK